MNSKRQKPKVVETDAAKIAEAVAQARAVRQKASDLSPEENERYFNLAMEIIYSEGAATSTGR
jgi:hypothetical protein